MRFAGYVKPNGDPDQSALARTIRKNGVTVTPQALQYLCDPKKDAIGSRHTAAIAAALGVNAVWLATGEGEMINPDIDQNIHTAPREDFRRIPVINRIPAGGPKTIIDDYNSGAGMDEITTDQELGPFAFALVIEGDSMLPEFTSGDKVIIDPDVRPCPGDFVAFKCKGDQSTFKKYRPRGQGVNSEDVFELVPLNPDYPTIRSDQMPVEIVGTMTEHRKYRRKR